MVEAARDSKTATIVPAVLAVLGVVCFALAGVAMFEQSEVTATSSLPAAPHVAS
jgi:hypothetical protein